MRKLPDVQLSPCPPEYARLVANGWDTIQEAYAFRPTAAFVTLLDAQQAKAREVDESDGIVQVEIAGQLFKLSARGTRRYRWRFENDDFIIFVGTSDNWAVSVRYLAAGLWEHGWNALSERVLEVLRPNTMQLDNDFVRVTRADYCFDFHAPTLKSELCQFSRGHIVAHSSVKKIELCIFSAGEGVQTFTVGMRSSVQIALYDKTREITEQSGKTWLYELYIDALGGQSPWQGRPRDVWRLEVRFFANFLKDRNCRRPHEVQSARDHLIAEALHTRRWVVPQSQDGHRQRWPMHPIWSEACRQSAAPDMLPLGRKVTGRRHALTEQLVHQLSGVLRSATVLHLGDYNEPYARALLGRAYAQVSSDRFHKEKVLAARDRYSDVDDAR